MEEFFNDLNIEDQNNLIKNTKEYNTKIDSFITSHNRDYDYSQKLIDSIQIILIKSGKVLNKFKNYDQVQLKLETIYYHFIELFLYTLDSKTIKQIKLNQLIKLLQIVKSQSRITLFQIKVFTRILDQIRNDADLKIDSEIYFDDLIKSFFIDLNISEFRNEIKENRALTSYFEELCNKWKNSIEYFFNSLSDEIYSKSIDKIQEFYEFCLCCCSNLPRRACPYKSIASRIISKSEKNNIYFNIVVENNTEKLKQILSLYKNILVENQDYDLTTIVEFGRQIKEIAIVSDNKIGYKFFIENHRLFCEYLFDSFIRAPSKHDPIYVLSKLEFDLKTIMPKLKTKLPESTKFNIWMIEKLIECVTHVMTNFNYTNQKGNDYINLDLAVSFIEYFIEYIVDHVKEKQCCILCLNLIISLLNLSNSHQRTLNLINRLFSKENFYLFKDYPNETIEILNLILDSASNMEKIDDNLLKQISSAIKSSLNYFKFRIMNFKDTISLIQNNLYERLIFEPIESNYIKNEYFESILDLMEYVSFEKYPKDATSLKRLKETFSLVVSPDFFESIELDDNNPRTKYYLSFFNKISESILTRNDILEILYDQFIQIIDNCELRNEFRNEYYSYKFTFNYHLVKELTSNLFKHDSINDDLIRKCISIWFQIYDEENLILSTNFYASMLEASKNYSKLVAERAYELWIIYLDTKNIILPPTLAKIYELSSEIFMKSVLDKFSLLLFDNNIENPIRDNQVLLSKIAEITPEYFFKNLPDKEINLFELFELCKLNSQKTELQLFFTFIHLLIRSINEKGLDPIYQQVLFENRLKLLRFLFVEGENKQNDKKRSFLSLPNHPISISLNFITNFYTILAFNLHDKDDVNILINELVDLFDEIKSKEAIPILFTLDQIGKCKNKLYLNLLKKHHDYFLTVNKDKDLISTSPELETALIVLINLIEGKTIEVFTNQLNQNTTNITKLEKTTKKQELKITNIKQDINDANQRINVIEETVEEQDKKIETIDSKTLFNLPLWCKDISKYLESLDKDAWVLVAKRLNFNENDIKGWFNQVDPCMSMLQEWFLINKTSDAIMGLLKIFKELNYIECLNIIESNQEEIEKNPNLNDEEINNHLLNKPPQIFICYEWSSKSKAELLRDHLVKLFSETNNDLNIWFDDGKYGGGELRNKRIDIGLRSCYVLICLITKEIVEDQTCLNQINLAVQLNKAILPLLVDNKLKWPPQGSLGPIMSEYLFIRFFQRPPKELTNDERYWPIDKFNELVMQIKQLVPMKSKADENLVKTKPEVFISYQWDKQKDIICLYNILTDMGLTVWLDIYQMGGGDSLYYKIDDGLRNCDVVVSCVTTKYGLSANCRKEIALADSLPKPIIPILLEKDMKYPPAGPMAPTLSVLKYIDFTNNFDENNSILWKGDCFNELLERMKSHLSLKTVDKVTSKACLIS